MTHILLFYEKCHFCHLLPFAKLGQYGYWLAPCWYEREHGSHCLELHMYTRGAGLGKMFYTTPHFTHKKSLLLWLASDLWKGQLCQFHNSTELGMFSPQVAPYSLHKDQCESNYFWAKFACLVGIFLHIFHTRVGNLATLERGTYMYMYVHC